MNTLYQIPPHGSQHVWGSSADYSVSTGSKPMEYNVKKTKRGARGMSGLPKPKRATSAYVYYSQHYRETLKKEGRPIPRIAEFGKECAAKWNVMTDKEKGPFLQMAASDKERYAKEIAKIKPQRDANKPKRPGTAFMIFMSDFRKEMAGREPAGGVAAMAKLGAERWRQMTDAEKKPYVDRQGLEKTKYDISMEQYKNKVTHDQQQQQQQQQQQHQQQQQQNSILCSQAPVNVNVNVPPKQPLANIPVMDEEEEGGEGLDWESEDDESGNEY